MPENSVDHWQRQGAKIRAIANDIKRNEEALAAELGMDIATVQSAFDGKAAPQTYDLIVSKMVETYPISRLDLEIRRDDTDEGVVIQSSAGSLASSRVFSRADQSGRATPYYEYRDAAMSAVGPYRPEWIKELRHVDSDDPSDPDVAYNSGHLMHQNTFFVGPVNFYWKIDGQAHMDRMDTGDSNYITPFVPHSFASRDPGREAYIVAVTFAGKLDSVHQDVMVLDPDGVEAALFDLTDRSKAFSGILRRELANAMLGLEHLVDRTGMKLSRLASLLEGHEFPEMDELEVMANAFGANVRDLLPPESSEPNEVVVRHRSQSEPRMFPSEEVPTYEVRDLAGTRKVPSLKSMSARVLVSSPVGAPADLDLNTPFHEFSYNYGSEPVQLYWMGKDGVRNGMVEPGGSYYIKPTVPHSLRGFGGAEPEMVIMRVGGALYGDAHLELSSYPKDGIRRALRETQQWYDPTKIGG